MNKIINNDGLQIVQCICPVCGCTYKRSVEKDYLESANIWLVYGKPVILCPYCKKPKPDREVNHTKKSTDEKLREISPVYNEYFESRDNELLGE